MSSNKNGGGSKYNLSRFSRVTSPNRTVSGEQSFNPNDTSHVNTTRTVSSSSASIMSTPSNNIRRFQQQHQNQNQNQNLRNRPTILEKKSNNGNLIKSKLLNLQGSSKKYLSVDDNHPNKNVQSFILHKPINMNMYDYSVYTNYSDAIDLQHSDNLPPAIKESQIKAWESAEKVSKNLIFDDCSESSKSDDNEEPDSLTKPRDDIIQCIPGYTKGELKIILKTYYDKQTKGYNKFSEDDERKLLWEYRQRNQKEQEQLFSQYQTFSGKRKVQVSQKKDLLHKMFGYSNNINQEYITNNSSYSAMDNVSNAQKAFQEDKEEMNQLLEEDKAYSISLQETEANLQSLKNSNLNLNIKGKNRIYSDTSGLHFDYDRYQNLVHRRLDAIYDTSLMNYDPNSMDSSAGDENDHNAFNEEFQSFATSYLRQCIKDDNDNDNDDLY